MPKSFAGRYIPGMFDSSPLSYDSKKPKQTARAEFLLYCRKSRLDPTAVLFKIAKWAVSHFMKSHQHEILENMLGFYRAALSVCPRNHRLRGDILDDLGRGLCSSYSATGNSAELKEGIQIQREGLTLKEPDPEERAKLIGGMAQSLMNNFDKTGKIDYMNISFELYEEALNTHATQDDFRMAVLQYLGHRNRERYHLLGNLSDLDKGIACMREAKAFCQVDSADWAEVHHSLALNLSDRYLQRGSQDDLREAIEMDREALRPERVDSDPAAKSRFLNQLANDLDNRFYVYGDMTDLNETILLRRKALAAATGFKSNRADCVHNLANSLFGRFRQMGDLRDLEEAIRLHREALSILPPEASQYSSYINNLGSDLAERYRCSGDLSDLEESIKLHRKALNLRKPADPLRSGTLNDLAVAIALKVDKSGDPLDIQETIELHREALKLRPTGHPYRSDTLHNLGNMLILRSVKHDRPNDLDEAIDLGSQALALRGEGHPDRSNSFNSLAYLLHERYTRTKVQEDLNHIVGLYRQALQLRPDPHPLRYHALMNLSSVLRERYDSLGERRDAEEALDMMNAVLQITSPGHADRAPNLVRLAGLHLDKKWPFYDHNLALGYMLEVTHDEHTDPQALLQYALHSLEAFEQVDDVDVETCRSRLLDVLLSTVALLPRAAAFAWDIRTRLAIVHKAQSVAVEAASHALLLARPSTALEVMEAGRALFWAQSLALRPDVSSLPTSLRLEFQELSGEIEKDSYLDLRQVVHGLARGDTPMKVSTEEEFSRRRRRTVAFDSLIKRVRTIAGQELFLLPATFEALVKITARGPVVALVASKISCDAVVMTDGRAEIVSLPRVTQEWLRQLSESLSNANRYSREVALEERALKKVDLSNPLQSDLATSGGGQRRGVSDDLWELWDRVVKPVFRALELQKPKNSQDRPRLWWCPTGQFVFLPIHAAGDYFDREGGECCSDYVMPSYTPTLTALLNARRELKNVPKSNAMTLLAAVPRPSQGSPLPATVEEIRKVREIIPEAVLVPIPASDDCCVSPDAGATVQTMLEKLPQAMILHLASHGVQHPKAPLESGFVMRDGMLTIEKLMPLPLPNAFLAFLSACETAKGDKEQPDQTVHLAATMLFAGFKSVVATMWSMSDLDGPEVAKTVYEHLFQGTSAELDPDVVPRALDAAVRKLRSEGLHPSRWAPYIHIGV